MALLAEACHWEWALRFKKPRTGSVFPFLPPAWGSEYNLLATAPEPCLPASPLPADGQVSPSETVSNPPIKCLGLGILSQQ